MRRKLDAFLKIYPVTIVYPIPHVKWLSWIDEESGEMSQKRKSPKKGNPYVAFKELYKIRPFLKNENLRFRFALIDMEEYRHKIFDWDFVHIRIRRIIIFQNGMYRFL